MAQVLRRVPQLTHPDLLVGSEHGDDAAVWRIAPDRALVATVDYFTPIVDDARTWGAIAGANAASDVYAMGGRPLFALNIAGWPRDLLPLELLGDVMEGGASVAARGGWVVVGGHTIDAPEPLYGQCVVGEVHPDQIMSNDRAEPGQMLVLTKPLGVGVITTAVKRLGAEATKAGGSIHDAYMAVVASMVRLNDTASRIAVAAGVRAATDVTGFGLAGHLHKLARESGLEATLRRSEVPVLPGVLRLLSEGFVPGGTGRNLEFVADALDCGASDEALIADPQTSGGLLLCVEPERVEGVVNELRATGHDAAIIGRLDRGRVGHVNVRD